MGQDRESERRRHASSRATLTAALAVLGLAVAGTYSVCAAAGAVLYPGCCVSADGRRDGRQTDPDCQPHKPWLHIQGKRLLSLFPHPMLNDSPSQTIPSPLKLQTRSVAAFPQANGFAVGSVEGRVALQFVILYILSEHPISCLFHRYIDDKDAGCVFSLLPTSSSTHAPILDTDATSPSAATAATPTRTGKIPHSYTP